jgi:transposase
MTKKFREWDVEQAWLLPPSVLELVPSDHPAHFIRELVRVDLDVTAILGAYTERRGQPPYHPVMMTALILYAYSRGVYSSRRIATGCQERVDFMAVTARQTPDFRTISDFRKRHLSGLEELFVQVLRLCQRAGLVSLGHVALDGTKVQANASKHKSMSYERMGSEESRLQEEVRGWLKRAERIDAEEDELYGEDRGDELPSWVADKQKRMKKIREAKEALEREAEQEAQELQDRRPEDLGPRQRAVRRTGKPPAKTQRNFTDPESRLMRTGRTYLQGYNCQAAVDADSQVIVARGVGNQQKDEGELVAVLNQIRANLKRQTSELSADSGYCTEANLKALRRRRIRGYMSTGRKKHGAPAPELKRGANSPWIRAMHVRLRRGGFRSRYRLRKQTVEPVFGQMKEALGFRRFLLRGLESVRAEWSLLCTPRPDRSHPDQQRPPHRIRISRQGKIRGGGRTVTRTGS